MHIPLFFKGELVSKLKKKKNFKICFQVENKKSHMQIITVGCWDDD